MNVTVYSTTSCGICHSLMQWLEKKDIAYNNVVVDTAENGMQELLEVSEGAIGTPFTVITKDDGGKEKIAGFNQKKLESALGL